MLKVGDTVKITLDREKKLASARNHTATHLLQAALKRVVGDQVNQAGSLVTPERLRFDFSNFEPVSPQQLADVEELVNHVILQAQDVEIAQMKQDEAKAKGAMALFGEKYGDIVRVVTVPGFSMELCGGSHVSNVGQIGMFKIVSETGVAAGVRRIEAITGEAALGWAHERAEALSQAAELLKCRDTEVVQKLSVLSTDYKEMKKKLDEVQRMREKADAQKLLMAVQTYGDVQFVTGKANVEGMDALREMADLTAAKLTNGVVVLCAEADGKVNIVAKASKEAVAKGVHAGNLIKEAAKAVGGGGGGRPEMAQAGGKEPEKIPQAMEAAHKAIKAQLGLE